MKIKPLSWAVRGLVPALLLPMAAQAEVFQAPYGPGGTWRIYETFPGQTATFKDAVEIARGLMDPVNGSVPGDLVSITSLAKETFVRRNLNLQGGDVWLGLTDREGVVDGAQESQTFGAAGEANRINGWRWTNGDEYTYRNWGAGEPNDAGGEDAVHFNAGGWNDNKSGYGVDDPQAPVLDPGKSTAEDTALAMRYIVEYSTNAASPFPGIRRGSVFPLNTELPAPPNTAGNWSVVEVRDLTMAGNILDALAQYLAGGGTRTEVQTPYIDFTDPNTNPNGGPILQDPPNPFPADIDTGENVNGDNNILMVAKTRLIIPASGQYTFQVRSDDGFALRIKNQAWTVVDGAGYIDPLDASTVIYETGTGDANTRAMLTLAAGQYDVDFIYWEGGGGAYCEITSATGNQLLAGGAQWLPLGSTDSRAEINTLNAVRMKADAAVTNINIHGRERTFPALRYMIDTAIEQGLTAGTTGLRENLELGEGDVNQAYALDDPSRMPFNNGEIDIDTGDGVNIQADNYITKVEGSFAIDADADGDGTPNEQIEITFGLFSDDGSSLRILGQDFLQVVDFEADTSPDVRIASLVDNGGDMTLTADYPSGNVRAYGRIMLREGETYNFVSYMYEIDGGSNLNIRWNLGNHMASGFPGHTGPSLCTESWRDDVLNLTEAATVVNLAIGYPANPLLPHIRAIFAEAIVQNVVQTTTAPLVLLRETAASAGTGSIKSGAGAIFTGTPVVMPAGAVENYATKVTGRLVVDNQNGTAGETIQATFGLFSDDGSQLRIIGQDFVSTSGGNVTLENINGDDALTADFDTGDTNAFGTITLTEGEYDFEAFHYEKGGGSGLEIWWALGEHAAFDPAVFRILNTTPGFFQPGNTGIALAAAGAQAPAIKVTAFSYNATTGAYELTFTSQSGTNYALDYTVGFQPAGTPASPQKWNVIPSKSSVAGAAGSTTVSGNISEIVTPGGQLPNGQAAFFRVRSL